jgi:hypothetical protein
MIVAMGMSSRSFWGRIVNLFVKPKLQVGDLVWFDKDELAFDRFDNIEPMTILDIFPMTHGLSGWNVAHVLRPGRSQIDIIDVEYLKKWEDASKP